MNMQKKKIIIPIAAVIAGLLLLLSYFRDKTNSNGPIKVSGNIEATEVRLSFQVAGKIKELLSDEGRFVKKGEIVARLDKDELTRVKEQTQARLKEAEFNYSRLKDDYARAENLFKGGALPEQQKDAANTSFEIAKARLKDANSSLELADIRLNYADLASPVDSFVIAKSAEAGEVMQIGSTVFTVADLNDIWLTAYINQTDLGKVKLNQQVNIRTDTYPDKIYRGRISFISQQAEFTPKQIQTAEERVKLVYRIKIAVNNMNLELKPGMPADGYIIIE
jgi:HlyD family secretion protein